MPLPIAIAATHRHPFFVSIIYGQIVMPVIKINTMLLSVNPTITKRWALTLIAPAVITWQEWIGIQLAEDLTMDFSH
jgi:hypothetical protein